MCSRVPNATDTNSQCAGVPVKCFVLNDVAVVVSIRRGGSARRRQKMITRDACATCSHENIDLSGSIEGCTINCCEVSSQLGDLYLVCPFVDGCAEFVDRVKN